MSDTIQGPAQPAVSVGARLELPSINLVVPTDPLSANVITALNAMTALCNFLCTPAGQAMCAKIDRDVNAVEGVIVKAVNAIGAFIHHKSGKGAGGAAVESGG